MITGWQHLDQLEELISSMRVQARALEAGADALDAALVQVRVAAVGVKLLDQTAQSALAFWTSAFDLAAGKATK